MECLLKRCAFVLPAIVCSYIFLFIFSISGDAGRSRKIFCYMNKGEQIKYARSMFHVEITKSATTRIYPSCIYELAVGTALAGKAFHQLPKHVVIEEIGSPASDNAVCHRPGSYMLLIATKKRNITTLDCADGALLPKADAAIP